MTNGQSLSLALRASLFTSAFLCSIGDAAAARDTIDPFSFCVESCKAPSCKEDGTGPLVDQCKKMCNGIWEQVAKLQMSRDRKDFRMEKPDSEKKQRMLYESSIAKCLKKEDPSKEPVKVDNTLNAAKVDKDANKAAGNTANNVASNASIKDLCAAAIKKEMDDLKTDTGALALQNHNLEKALKDLEAAKQPTP